MTNSRKGAFFPAKVLEADIEHFPIATPFWKYVTYDEWEVYNIGPLKCSRMSTVQRDPKSPVYIFTNV